MIRNNGLRCPLWVCALAAAGQVGCGTAAAVGLAPESPSASTVAVDTASTFGGRCSLAGEPQVVMTSVSPRDVGAAIDESGVWLGFHRRVDQPVAMLLDSQSLRVIEQRAPGETSSDTPSDTERSLVLASTARAPAPDSIRSNGVLAPVDADRSLVVWTDE